MAQYFQGDYSLICLRPLIFNDCNIVGLIAGQFAGAIHEHCLLLLQYAIRYNCITVVGYGYRPNVNVAGQFDRKRVYTGTDTLKTHSFENVGSSRTSPNQSEISFGFDCQRSNLAKSVNESNS